MLDRRRPTPLRLAVRRSAWPLSLALLLEVVACSIALAGLIQGSDWLLALLGTAALLLAVPAALRAVGVPPWLASLLDVVAFAGLVQLVYGIASTPALFQRALLAIQDQQTPAVPLPELIFFVVLFGGAMAVLLDLLAVTLRVPALTAIVVGGVLVVPAVLQPSGLSLIALGAAAGAWLAVLRADGAARSHARGGGALALGLGASVTLVSLVVAATAPGFVEPVRVSTSGPVVLGSSVNPLIDLGADLRRPTPVDVLSYTTASKTPEYLQLTTLDDIHGTDWTHSSTAVSPLKNGTGLAAAPGLDSALGISAAKVTTSIAVQSLRSNWVPAPYPTTTVKGEQDAHVFQPNDLTIYESGGELSGAAYTTTSLDLEPTSTQLAGLSAQGFPGSQAFAGVSDDLSLPGKVPAIITDTAHQIAAGASGTSEFDLALAIQHYFQDTRNGFTYSTNSPDTRDGASLAVIARFLEVKEGYCVHFASSMAVLARVLGIPSRIAIGYLPGSPIATKGSRITYQVDSSDLHAWPQLYFPGVGWLDFEPTVSRGAAPAYTLASTPQAGQASAPLQSAAPTTAATPRTSPRAVPQQQAAGDDNPVAARNGVPLELGILIVLAALASPAIARALRRRGRLRRLREDGAPPGVAWDEIRDTARDLGFAVSATETPRAFAARLRADWPPDAVRPSGLDEVLTQLELAEFGPPRPWERYFELADTTESVIAALRASRPLRLRLIATFAPASLFTPIGELRRSGGSAGQ